VASSVYLINDLLDLDSDRIHETKKFRPFASGSLSPIFGIVLIPQLLFFGFLIAFKINTTLLATLLIYFIITIAYSFGLKRIVILDVVILGLLFTLRLLAGHFACDIFISPWLLGFSIFIFTSLACLKRYSEL